MGENEENESQYAKRRYWVKVVKKLVPVLLAFIALFICFKCAIFFLPFVIALIINKITTPLINLMTNKWKFNYKVSVIISVVLVVAILGTILTFSVLKLTDEIYEFASNIPTYVNTISTTVTALLAKAQEVFTDVPEVVMTQITTTIDSISKTVLGKATDLTKALLTGIMSLPTIIVYTIITILATLFIGMDKKYIKETFIHQLPDEWSNKIFAVSKDIFSALGAYIKSVFTIIGITFIELLIGFTVIKLFGFDVPYVFATAVGIAIVDALPILGCGTVLIPWAAFCALTGDINFAIVLFCFYLVITIIRNLIEPKIVSKNIGVHPILTLLAMYIGFKFFGFIGLILGPITVFILKGIFAKQLEKGFFRDIFQQTK